MFITVLLFACASPIYEGPAELTTPDEPGDHSSSGEDSGASGNDDPGGEDPGGEDPGGEGSEDAAEVVSADLPTQIECGESYDASVVMRNTGTATWSHEAGYKLGTVSDEDALYGPDTRVWLPEGVTVPPGESHEFEFELSAPFEEDDYLTDWQMVHEGVRWFGEQTAETVVVSCDVQMICDPLTSSSLQSGFSEKIASGGSFSDSGWQTTDNDDQLRLEMSTPLSGSGTLEIDVTNFDPGSQVSSEKHQVINMYTSDNGSQDVFVTDEAWWNIRTGTNYSTGFKLLAAGNGGDSREEVRLIEDASWDASDTHTFTVTWDAEDIDIYLDGSYLETLAFDGRVQPLQYIFVGKDNVYAGHVGPIYSNLCVTYE